MNRANGGNDSCRLALGALVAGIVALQVPAGTPADGFLPSGKFTLGANYWASRNATKMWREWDEAEVEKDLIALKEAGQYAQPGWKVYRRVCAVSRAVTTEKPDILVSEHPLVDGRIAVIAVNNDPNPYEGRPTVAEGHTVVQALTDDEAEAAWDGGRLRLAGNAGILLMLGRTDGKGR